MKVINEAYVNNVAAYDKNGGLIIGTQRIPNNHPIEY